MPWALEDDSALSPSLWPQQVIEIQSLLTVGDELVAFGDFAGPILDEDYIEGAIELTVNRKPILLREQVDYVDQLWAYLITGLEEISEGRDFSTYYPDMPVEIVLRPSNKLVTIRVDRKKSVSEATLPLAELRHGFLHPPTHLRRATPAHLRPLPRQAGQARQADVIGRASAFTTRASRCMRSLDAVAQDHLLATARDRHRNAVTCLDRRDPGVNCERGVGIGQRLAIDRFDRVAVVEA
jgi:hypothetical protein